MWDTEAARLLTLFGLPNQATHETITPLRRA